MTIPLDHTLSIFKGKLTQPPGCRSRLWPMCLEFNSSKLKKHIFFCDVGLHGDWLDGEVVICINVDDLPEHMQSFQHLQPKIYSHQCVLMRVSVYTALHG